MTTKKRKADSETGEEKKSKKAKVTACPITKADFEAKAKDLKLTIDGKEVSAKTKVFARGSFGWNFSGKETFTVDGVEVPCTISMNITAIKSAPPKPKKKKKAAESDEEEDE